MTKRLRLRNLRGVYQMRKVFGVSEIAGDIIQYSLIASSRTALAIFHNRRKKVQVLFGAKGTDGFHGRQGFESEFRHKTEIVLFKFGVISIPPESSDKELAGG
jgi:hypothetical protein